MFVNIEIGSEELALEALVSHQYIEYVTANARYGDPAKTVGRTLFTLTRTNFLIAAEMHELVVFPEGTEFGFFENYREYGLTYTVGGWTFAVYQHRNSDEMHLEGCPTDEVMEYGPYGSDDKYDTLAHVKCDDFNGLSILLESALRIAAGLTNSTQVDHEGMKVLVREFDLDDECGQLHINEDKR